MNRFFSHALSIALCAVLLAGPSSALAATQLSALDQSEIATSYQHLTSDFYRKTDAQSIINGARAELLNALHHSGVSTSLPALVVAQTPTGTVRGLDREVELASKAASGKLSPHLLSYAAISGMMKSVNDRYTVFMTPKEYAALNEGLDGGDFGGTGIVIQVDDATKLISVSNIVPNGPADRAGVEQDDLIISIDGVSTKGLSLQQASSRLRGKEGTKVTLMIQRNGSTTPLTITRAKIHQLSVYEKMLPGKIGYVALTVFGRDTGAELTTALDRLQQGGARAIVLDLRDNGGGYLESAVSVSSKFISSGPIVSVESRASNITTIEADDTAIAPLPLAVLVNGYTASASEITSGAIQDSGVGTIIGTRTFGKGVVQTIYPLPDGSAVKITTARYLTPRNRDINHLGIAPDITLVENKNPRFGDPTRDSQLQRAMQFLSDKIAHTAGGSGM